MGEWTERKEFWSMLFALIFGIFILTIIIGVVLGFSFFLIYAIFTQGKFNPIADLFPIIISMVIFVMGYFCYYLVRDTQEKFLEKEKGKLWIRLVLLFAPSIIITLIFPVSKEAFSVPLIFIGFFSLNIFYDLIYSVRKARKAKIPTILNVNSYLRPGDGCPKCNSRNVKLITYGKISETELNRYKKQGYFYGGVPLKKETKYCANCKHKW